MATGLVNLSDYHFDSSLDGSSSKITLIVSQWNESITNSLKSAAIETLVSLKVNPENIKIIYVPGSFELIYGAKLAQEKNPDAVIVIGSIIQGETKHFDFICNAISNGIKDLNVRNKVPVIFCVLTDYNLKQAQDRSGGKYGNKGIEAAIAAIKMSKIRKEENK
tara:strand:- start:1145 stop:1636 length:492 start_codon:yes stop_codon:yes gene_type:complete